MQGLAKIQLNCNLSFFKLAETNKRQVEMLLIISNQVFQTEFIVAVAVKVLPEVYEHTSSWAETGMKEKHNWKQQEFVQIFTIITIAY